MKRGRGRGRRRSHEGGGDEECRGGERE